MRLTRAWERERAGWYVGGRDGRRGQQTATCISRSPFYIFAVLSFQKTTHVDATQPSTSRTREIQFLAADTLAAGHMWRIASMTRSTRSPKAHFRNSPYAQRREEAESARTGRIVSSAVIQYRWRAQRVLNRGESSRPIISRFTRKDDRF